MIINKMDEIKKKKLIKEDGEFTVYLDTVHYG